MADDNAPVADDGTNPLTGDASPFSDDDAAQQRQEQAQAAFDTLRRQRAFISAIRRGKDREAMAYNTMGR